MTRLHYPNQPFSPAPSHSFFLDTSFIIAGIGKRPQCYALLDSLLGHPLHLSELVWAEALHVRQVPLDSYDALHLAVAFRAGCSHLVTRDADFGLASEVCPVAVLQVA